MTSGFRASGISASRPISARTTPDDVLDQRMSVAPRAAAAPATRNTPDFSKESTVTRMREFASESVAEGPNAPVASPWSDVDPASGGAPYVAVPVSAGTGSSGLSCERRGLNLNAGSHAPIQRTCGSSRTRATDAGSALTTYALELT